MQKIILFLLYLISLQANTIIHNATIYTVNDTQPYAQAIVIQDEKILYIGENQKALSFQNSNSQLIDAKHAFIMPGFVDSHTHTALAALLLNTGVNLYKARGKKGILKALKAYKDSNPNLNLYTGVGFYPYAFGPNGPTKEELDTIFPNTKAFFISNNGHQAWANSKALAFLKIDKNTLDPLPKVHYYVRDKNREPTGFLIEGEAFWPHLKTLGIGKTEAFKSSLKTFLPQLSAIGITTIYDASIPAIKEYAYQAIRQIEKEKNLHLRYKASHFILSTKDAENASVKLRQLQNTYNSKLFQVSSIKFINDNSDDDNFAIPFEQVELTKYLLPIIQANQDIMIHVTQDQSIHQALNAIQTAKKSLPQTQSRICLAHVNMVRDEDFKRFKELNIIANVQPFDAQGGGYYEYRYMLYDEKWEHKLARYKHFFDEDVIMSSSSDYPACNKPLKECSPFHGIQIGITRQKVDAQGDNEILDSKEERLSLHQSIKAYTLNGAYQLHIEDKVGSLEVGKEADIIFLSEDPFKLDVKDIHKIKITKTIFKGQTIYEQD